MELMEMSLDSLIENRAKASRSFPILVVLDIITQIARGVWFLHDLHVAHRDLKPLNVVVTETRSAHLEDFFCVKLVDFGMSKTKVQVFKSNTISIPGVGTTKYRAPEVYPQARQVAEGLKRKVNWFRADAYSFGITCAALLSLKKPFEDVPASKLYEELLQGVRPELPGECPEALVALLKDCWATDPQSRPGFAEICSRLEHCKLQEFLRASSEGLMGSECIETVATKHTRVPYFQSQCTSTIPLNSDDTEEAVGNSQFAEKASPPDDDYSEDRPSIILSELEPKKKVGLWSHTMSSLARLVSMDSLMDGLLSKKFKESRSMQLKFQQKCKEFDVKPTLFPYNELRVATQDFHPCMKLGESYFGERYKGVLPNGNVVTVKKSLFGLPHFLNEVVLFTGMKHRNLVTLKGCCLHDQQFLVVYEYVENFVVSEILQDKGLRRQMVSWPMRLKICLGVAQGLHYLHALAHPKIIHRDIKAKNVLLDENLDPKINDFGHAILFPDEQSHVSSIEVMGTKGYLAPEYLTCGILSDKADVYSFGVLCLEIISGRCNNDEIVREDQIYVNRWAWQLHEEGRLLEIVDPTLHLTDVEVQSVQRVIKLCLMCLEFNAESRPSMAHVVSILQGNSE